MRLHYLAHPLRPALGETLGSNLYHAKRYLRTLNRGGLLVIAPWIGLVEALDETRGEDREHGLRVDLEVVRRCDVVVLVGPRVSPGMRLEAQQAFDTGGAVANLMGIPPEQINAAYDTWQRLGCGRDPVRIAIKED